MMNGAEREAFALQVMKEVRRWPGVQMLPHINPLAAEDGDDGVEFRLYGRQIGHVHPDCSVHLSLTKALKQTVIEQGLAQSLELAGSAGWAAYQAERTEDAARAIWLLRLNYVRLRRQRMSPDAAASSELLREHERALGELTPSMSTVLQRTQARAPRPLPPLL
jgi:luciferase-like monooxygenase